MAAQNTMMDKQNDMLNNQIAMMLRAQFDNTFFNLLSSANEMTNEISYLGSDIRSKGKVIFRDIMSDYDKFEETQRIDMANLNIADAFFREKHPNVALWSSRPLPVLICNSF